VWLKIKLWFFYRELTPDVEDLDETPPEEDDEEEVILVNEGIQTSTLHVPEPPLEEPAPVTTKPLEPEAPEIPRIKLQTERELPQLTSYSSPPDRLVKFKSHKRYNKSGFGEDSIYDNRTGLIKDKLGETEKETKVKTAKLEVKSHAVAKKPSKKVTLSKYTSRVSNTRTNLAIQDLLKQAKSSKTTKKKSPSKKKLGAKAKKKPNTETKAVTKPAW